MRTNKAAVWGWEHGRGRKLCEKFNNIYCNEEDNLGKQSFAKGGWEYFLVSTF